MQSVFPNGPRLKELRNDRGWGQKEVLGEARRLGCQIGHVNTVSQAEAGTRKISVATLTCFSKIYSVPYSDLVLHHESETPDYNGYWLGPYSPKAIRLIGADSEFFPPETIHIHIDLSAYDMPDEIESQREAILAQLKKEAQQRHAFWDGPNTRLVDFRPSPRDSTEQKHLELVFGPVGWYDYSVVNTIFARNAVSTGTIDRFVNVESIAEGNIKDVQFTNIVDTMTVLLTSDGFAIYVKRSTRVSAGVGLFSAIAENIHPEKDGSLIPPTAGNILAPFRAVMRGIEEEISPELARRINPRAALLLGLGFNLDYFHPDMLFLVALSCRAADVMKIAREFPGRDYFEGKIFSVRANRDDRQLSDLLSTPDNKWEEGGKAALIRAMEFLAAVERRQKISTTEIIKRAAAGNTAWIE